MSENLNVANDPAVDQETIPTCGDQSILEPIDNNIADHQNYEVEADISVSTENCATMDIGESTVEGCEENGFVLTDKNNDNIGELEMAIEKPTTDDKLMDVDDEITEVQMDIDATCNTYNELTEIMSVPSENIIMETNNTIDETIPIINETVPIIDEDMADLSANDVLKPIDNSGSKYEDVNEIVSRETTSVNDKILYENSSTIEQQTNQNNLILNSEISHQRKPELSATSEILLKTNTRPQRQAAKKAENQIREIAKDIIKPIDIIDEKIIDSIEGLSSPLKKVCCQCNRFRLCKFTVKGCKAMFLCQDECVANYRIKNDQYIHENKCEQCLSVISGNESKTYCWETKHFCSIDCLSNYQNTIFDSNCSHCLKPIKSDTDLGKFCRYISGKILQFCGTMCIDGYENVKSLCNFCHKELDERHSKDFCSSFCQTKDFESRKKHIEPNSSIGDYGTNETSYTINKCSVCFCVLNSSSSNDLQIFSHTNTLFKFCSNQCLNKFIVSKKRTVSCSVCKYKKFNSDMISTKNLSSNSPTYVCSLNCLHQQQELPQGKSKKVICDKCGVPSQGRYKTVLNATTYNFCSKSCVNSFKSSKKQKSKSKNGKQSSSSRASTRKSARKEENNLTVDIDGTPNSQQKTSKGKSKICRKISYEDISVLPKVDKEVQTDQTGSKGVIIPVPVPVYIPMPMQMYVMPYPVPVPIPIPLPIPIFIPTTRNTTKAILKDIKKIKEETPSDPFEAELLMMAGIVADDQKIENSSSDSENDVSNNEYNDDTKVVSSSARNHNSFGDDVLAMALNMAGADTENLVEASDISTITVNNQANQIIDDVEANLVSSTIMPQTPNPADSITQEDLISSPQDMLRRPPRKRAPRTQSQRNTNVKRSRKTEFPQVQSSVGPQQPQQQLVQNPPYSIPMSAVKPDANMSLKYTLGVNAWRQWASIKSIEFEKTLLSSNVCGVKKTNIFKLDLLQLTASELNYCLCLFVKEVRKPNGSEYAPDTIYYLCLGVQQYLFENGRIDNIFTDTSYEQFTECLNEVAKRFAEIYNDTKFIVTRVEEEYLWESKQLGAHSPFVLLCTLIFFNAKHFNLTNAEEHMQLSFSHIMKHWKRNPNQPSTSGVKAPGTYRNVLLRFYPPQASLDSPNSRKKKVYEQHENEENPLRCPVKLYEFYLSKCPESVKTRNDLFYLTPERSCVPDSPVWYSTSVLNKESLEKMLNRVKMVKEINVALLSS